ncbi:MAG: hypothetical protein ACREI9_10605 [Nitrospiraceae bacterium]
MRRFLWLSWVVAVLSLALGGEMPVAEETSTVGKLPSAIQEFYENYNFVMAFSEVGERSIALTDKIVCRRGKELSFLEIRGEGRAEDPSYDQIMIEALAKELQCESTEIPSQLKPDSRLGKIRRAMYVLEQRVLRVDPRISGSPDLPADLARGSGLAKIHKARCGKETIVLDVSVYSLDPPIVEKLIADFGAGKRKIVPSPEELSQIDRVELADGSYAHVIRIPQKQIHKWILIDGQWFKQEANLVLLQGQSSGSDLMPCS